MRRKAFHVKVISVLTALIAVLSLAGCGQTFDAGSYAKAMLDAAYKGESAGYVKQEIGSKEDAQKLYEDNLSALVESFSEIFGSSLDKETKQKLNDAMAAICAKVKYDVGQAEKSGKGYTVDVRVKPLLLSEALQDETFTEKAEKAVKKEVGKNSDVSADELTAVLTDLLIGRFQEIADSPEYGEEKSVTLELIQNDDGAYEISNDSWDKIDQMLMQ